MRLPVLKPSKKKGPILPGFDIRIGELSIDNLEIGKAVTGTARSGRLKAALDVRSGRAVAKVNAAIDNSDALLLDLDAEPDGDRFDLELRARSRAGGVLPALVGSKRSLEAVITGDGTWKKWKGRAALDLSGHPAARLALTATNGRFGLSGVLRTSDFLHGRLMRLTAPTIRVRGDAQIKDRLLDGKLILGSSALRAAASGTLDLGKNRFRSVRIGLDLLRPPALFTNMTGRNVRALITLNGPFATADYAYRLTSPAVKFDDTGFVDVRAEGRGRLSPWPMRVPLHLQARALTGVGDTAGAILANTSIDGLLTVTPHMVRGEGLQLRSAQTSGKVSLLIDLDTGRFEVLLSGGMHRYFIDGLGLVDVLTELKVVPAPGGHGTLVTGTGKAWVRRLDNSFFQSLTGGLPRITTDLTRTPDGILHLTNLQLYSPRLRLSGQGIRRRDGTFHIEAHGRQEQYGPVRMIVDGDIARPHVELFLDRPNDSLGLEDVHLTLAPTAAGYDYRANGGSTLGPFTSTGQILMPHGAETTIAVAALDVNGTHATGNLRADPGGFNGTLRLGGGGLTGTVGFQPFNGAQKIEAHLNADHASFPGALSVRSGRLDGTILLADQRTTMSGVVNARGVELSGVSLARVTANANLVNGSGQIRAAVAGRRGAEFEFATLADISPDSIRLTGHGEVDRKPLVLKQAAVLTRSGDGWALAPTRVGFAGGEAVVSGNSGSHPTVHARLQSMPLSVLNIASPDLDLGGQASGSLEYAWKGSRSGSLDLTVRGLSRAGLVLASEPIDLGVKAILTGDKAGLRAVAVSDGKTIGRAQARLAPLGGGSLATALLNAPLFAQLRFQGPADTLWRLSGIELFDLTGPAAIAADVGGTLSDPIIRGSLKTENARLESPITGTVIDHLVAQGRFQGSQFLFSNLSGKTPGGGSVSGSGTIAFSQAQTRLDLSFNATQARLLNRDDVSATVTGPLKVRSGGSGGGTISGDLHLDSGRFTLGQASSAASVPQLDVKHTGLDEADVIEPSQVHPWKLDLGITGGKLAVTGLGIRSTWTTDLHVGGAADSPAFTGRADLVRGDYGFAGRTFRLDRGVIRFRGESPPNPLLDIRALAQVQGLDATILVQGTGLKPEISFASNPQLPQDELLSRILFGTSITNLSAPEAIQLASAVAALNSGTGSLDPINALRRAVGLDRLRILPADIATGQKTAIAAGKYIGRKLYVEVITDGHEYSATRVEYELNSVAFGALDGLHHRPCASQRTS